jgi:hypothetical protein
VRSTADDDVRDRTPVDAVVAWLGEPRPYRLVRSLVLRLLGVVYLFAFLGLTAQAVPLLGDGGILPAVDRLDRLAASGAGFVDVPTLFWIDCSDTMLVACAWIGVVLAAVVVAGYANAPVMAALWILQLSFRAIGQRWYTFGWEIQLLETGFLAIFLAPPLDPRPLKSRPPPLAAILLYRWLAFRIMLGAGLIKLRGDACWTELTCLDFHFETQPIPNPLSPLFHAMPHGALAAGVLVNHLVELIAPWLIFSPRKLRLAAAAAMASFQLILIASGNLAFLNWLTLVPIAACLDDDAIRWLLPARVRAWVDRRCAAADAGGRDAPTRRNRIVLYVVAAVIAFKSLDVVLNLMSSDQSMNRSYDRLALVNTYGAFGSVGDTRRELIIEGTRADDPDDPAAAWQAYELPCKPGALDRRPCFLGPYHHRLDWLIWFAAMDPGPDGEPWMWNLVAKLLVADPEVRSLFAVDPFGDEPPRWIRIRRFRYRFGDDTWWTRDQEETWLEPVAIGSVVLEDALALYGFR